jgi:hypothetical protein
MHQCTTSAELEPITKDNERRASTRHDCSLDILCNPVLTTSPRIWRAALRDISCVGLRLTLLRRFEARTLLRICLPEQGDFQGLSLFAHVVQVRRDLPRKWTLGCALAGSLHPEDLQLLLSASAAVLKQEPAAAHEACNVPSEHAPLAQLQRVTQR